MLHLLLSLLNQSRVRVTLWHFLLLKRCAFQGAQRRASGERPDVHLAKATNRRQQAATHLPTGPPMEATANLAAATAVALPESSTPAPRTTRKRGRPANAERAAAQKATEEQAVAEQAAAQHVAPDQAAVTTADEPSAAGPSTDVTAVGDAAPDLGKAGKTSKAASKSGGARASGGRTRKQDAPIRVTPPEALAEGSDAQVWPTHIWGAWAAELTLSPLAAPLCPCQCCHEHDTRPHGPKLA